MGLGWIVVLVVEIAATVGVFIAYAMWQRKDWTQETDASKAWDRRLVGYGKWGNLVWPLVCGAWLATYAIAEVGPGFDVARHFLGGGLIVAGWTWLFRGQTQVFVATALAATNQEECEEDDASGTS